LPLVQNAERIREEAVALLSAKQCPSGKKTLILGGSQLGLQIHESVGHATELDRVLGMEANYAGTSFATPEKLGNFTYGSPIVNLFCDSTMPGGLATVGFDDDGVRAQRWHLVKEGQFVGYQYNRELAHTIGKTRSSGNNRADGWNRIPIVRITNLSLEPGEWELDDMIASTDDGIFMETNKSWSIDQRRLNFQFGCEIGWEISHGKKGRMVKNPTYQSITPEFWKSCDAIGNQKHFVLWGVHNCGKGQPGQRAEMSHGAAPARFRQIEVGVAKG
jgi:TldD protein